MASAQTKQCRYELRMTNSFCEVAGLVSTIKGYKKRTSLALLLCGIAIYYFNTSKNSSTVIPAFVIKLRNVPRATSG